MERELDDPLENVFPFLPRRMYSLMKQTHVHTQARVDGPGVHIRREMETKEWRVGEDAQRPRKLHEGALRIWR